MRTNDVVEQFLQAKASPILIKESPEKQQVCEEVDEANITLTPENSNTTLEEELVKKEPIETEQKIILKKAPCVETGAIKKPNKIKYTVNQLKVLENSTESRKPPVIDCKSDAISQLMLSRPHFKLQQKFLQTQYSNYESIDFGGKRGMRDINRGNLKKHHEQSLSMGNTGARDLGLQQREMDYIRVQLLLKEEIKLSECENAWQPDTLRNKTSEQTDSLEVVLKKVRGVLNKLTPDNFDVLLKTMASIVIDTQEKMQQVMLLVFEKTVSEPNFAPTYAKFCKVLFQDIKTENRSLFGNSLIKRIQHEFETNVNDADAKRVKLQPLIDKLENCVDAKERLELQAEIEESEFQFRRRAWGTVRFIGEMYKLQSLTTERVLLCLESLLQQGCEEKLEYMCKLLTTVGPLLEAAQPDNINRLDKIFRRTQDIVNKSRSNNNNKNQYKISSRVRFMMQDVIDLRQRSWDQNFLQNKGRNVSRADSVESSQSTGASNYDQRSQFNAQQRGRFQNKAGQAQSRGQAQGQSVDNAMQKQNIDSNKLRFTQADNITVLGNKHMFTWPQNNQPTTASNTNSPTTTKRSNKSSSKTRANSKTANTVNKNQQVNKQPFNALTLLNRLVEELLNAGGNWREEILQQWSSITNEQQVNLLHFLLSDYLHLAAIKRAERQACAQIFMYLMQLEEGEEFKLDIFNQAYAQFGEEFPDLLVDVPNGWAYVFDFVGPIWQAGLLKFSDIWLSIWANDEHFTERFVKAMFNYYLSEFGKNYTSELWQRVFGGDKPLSTDLMENPSRWLDYGIQLLDERCKIIKDTALSQQQQQQRLNIYEQLERIKHLLNAEENSVALAEDYIATNVHITNNFLHNLTHFICCEYAIQNKSKYKGKKAKQTKHLNEKLFKTKCIPLLRSCLKGFASEDFSIWNEIVTALESYHDKCIADKLVEQIFKALYETDLIAKSELDSWYLAHKTNNQVADNNNDDEETFSASSAGDSLTDDLDATLTSLNVEFIATNAQQVHAISTTTIATEKTVSTETRSIVASKDMISEETTTFKTQTRYRRNRKNQRRGGQNQAQHSSRSGSNSTSTSTTHSPAHTFKSRNERSGGGGGGGVGGGGGGGGGRMQLNKPAHEFMERLI